jgi:peptide/nickel transport system substrate-binding protein
MRPLLFSLALVAILLTACATATPGPLPTVAPTSASANTPVTPTSIPAPQRAPLLRIAILGETTTTNVWSLFDEAGASYWNAATQASYWPTLYRLTPPFLDFQPATAQGEPSPVKCDTTTCTATVTLQPNLTWTDGTPFTGDDVAFTVNTALQFRLGLNWQEYYNPDVLEHVEALDRVTIKFYFKSRPTVADWQYGALLGPIVSQAYWQPRIVDAVSLLPDETLLPTIQELEAELAGMQSEIEKLDLSLNTMVPGTTVYQDTSRDVQHIQDDLNGVSNKLEKNRTEYETQLAEACASLFKLANAKEPTLGPWKFTSRIEDSFENQANLGTPLGDPWFDSVHYTTYPTEAAAVDALLKNDVDLILTPDGLSAEAISLLQNNPGIVLRGNITRNARFLAFNQANPYLADSVLRQALACMLDPQALVEELGSDATQLPGFVVDDTWRNKDVSLPCAGATEDTRLAEAVRLLKETGYSWDEEPASSVGFKAPNGDELPHFTLLVSQEDPMREIAARYIAQQAKILGLALDVKINSSDDLWYAVYGTGGYDMALLGWHLSVYPVYLCDWFMPSDQNPFAYNGSSLKSACEAWAQVSDLEVAKARASDVQTVLMHDLPLIPLYADVRVDAYRNIQYRHSNIVDGLGGLYGATVQAIPIP